MQRIFLSICLLLSVHAYSASDTLKLRDIYSFSVGDTFDYYNEWQATGNPIPYSNYSRSVVTQKTFSPGLDTLYIHYNNIAPETITNLDSSVTVLNFPNAKAICNYRYGYLDSTLGQVSNTIDISCFESGDDYRYTKGLGNTHAESWSGGTPQDYSHTLRTLIYYSNGVKHLGTPYYVANQSVLTEPFMPIPEHCAEWHQRVIVSMNPIVEAEELIRTGPIDSSNGLHWVSLLYSFYNPATGARTSDSLIGYFRNDTLQKAVWFCEQINGTEQLLFSFSETKTATISLSKETLYGITRTKWLYNYGIYGSFSIFGGIGSTNGFINAKRGILIGPNSPIHLTCFSVCGQVQFSENNQTVCYPLAINQTENDLLTMTMNGHVLLLQNQFSEAANIHVLSVDGREVNTTIIPENTTSTVDLSTLQSGVYLCVAQCGNTRKTLRFSVVH